MATNNMVPYSNPAGRNQTSPALGGAPKPIAVPGAPTQAASKNPLIPSPAAGGAKPMTSGSTTGAPQNPVPAATPNGGNTSSGNGFITSAQDSGQNALQKQLDDIYGAGVGGSLFALLEGMSGSNSTILQEYIQSLQPQMAKAQAGVNASLGAGGVSSNSSVAALADANLQSQEFSAIAGESANLTQSQEQLTASLLGGMEGAAAKEVATSGWSIFGDVMGDISQDVGAILHGGAGAKPGQQQQTGGSTTPASQYSGTPSVPTGTAMPAAPDATNWDATSVGSEGYDAGVELAAYS